MRQNKLVALAAVALLGAGVLGISGIRAFAQGLQTATPVTVPSHDCSQDQADSAEVKSAASDTDTVDLQCGDQSGADTKETVNAADTDNVEEQVGDQVGDQNGIDTGSEAPEAAAPAGK